MTDIPDGSAGNVVPGTTTESQRNAVVSAANLLLVGLLKLNNVIVPTLLRWMHARRETWIRRSSSDIAREMERTGKRPRLCVGSCCGGSYGSILAGTGPETPNVHPDVLHAWLQAGGDTSPASLADLNDALMGSLGAVGEEDGGDDDGGADDDSGESDGTTIGLQGDIETGQPHAVDDALPAVGVAASSSADTPLETPTASTPLTAAAPPPKKKKGKKEKGASTSVSTMPSTKGTLSTVPPLTREEIEEDIYFRLKVLEEERHRTSTMVSMTYTSVMAVHVTLLTLVLYAAVIISLVLYNFHFDTWEAIIFSFALISTAIISESETLLQVKDKVTEKGGLTSMLPTTSNQKEESNVTDVDTTTNPDGTTEAHVPTAQLVTAPDSQTQHVTEETVSDTPVKRVSMARVKLPSPTAPATTTTTAAAAAPVATSTEVPTDPLRRASAQPSQARIVLDQDLGDA